GITNPIIVIANPIVTQIFKYSFVVMCFLLLKSLHIIDKHLLIIKQNILNQVFILHNMVFLAAGKTNDRQRVGGVKSH
ncbi:hypothetical protein ACH66Y_00170, partial [Klebsiella pneumoniae]